VIAACGGDHSTVRERLGIVRSAAIRSSSTPSKM
jgi:hypothetical protein